MRRTATALVLASGLLASACASTVDGIPTAAGSAPSGPSSSSSSSAPTSDASGSTSAPGTTDYSVYLLEQSELPDGYEVEETTPEDLEDFTSALTADGLDVEQLGVTIEPPQCTETSPFGDLTQVALTTALNYTTFSVVSQVAGPAGDGLDRLRSLLADCSTIEVSFTGPDGAPFASTAANVVLPDPAVDADEVLAFSRESTVVTGASPFSTTQVVLYAAVGDVVVGVTSFALSEEPVDQGVLSTVLGAAVAKVRAG